MSTKPLTIYSKELWLSMNSQEPTSVYGIVSLIDSGHRRIIQELWKELESRFDLPHLYEEPLAHFSYHVVQQYDLKRLKTIISQFVNYKSSFTVRTEGLGMFNKSEPVIYIPVVRNPQLATFHRSLWELATPWSSAPLSYYHPDCWMPHITLIHGNISLKKLPEVVSFLASRDFNWEIKVSNISIICSTCHQIDPDLTFKLPPQ